jgi:arginine-tRNA-protein transferase
MSIDDRRQLMFFQTAPQECAYVPERTAIQRLADPYRPLSRGIYSQLMARGFRRSGCFIYRPDCPTCDACIPARVPVADFRPNRAQRRNQRHNHDLHWQLAAPSDDPEYTALYQRYLQHRHPGGGMDESGDESLLRFLACDWFETRFLELRDGDGHLFGVAVTDVLDDALSAVYTFFEPDEPRRGLGTFAVLSQLELAREMGLSHIYLGYWIRELSNMAYKARFRPLEVHVDNQWQSLETLRETELPGAGE